MATVYKSDEELLQELKEAVSHFRERLEKAKSSKKDEWFHHSDYSEAWDRYNNMRKITRGE